MPIYSRIQTCHWSFSWPIFLGLSMIGLLLGSCEYERPQDEGLIVYDLTFPFLEESILKNVFPEEMKLHFKDGKMHGEIRSLGGIVKTTFVTDNRKKEISQMLKNYSEYDVCTLNEEGVRGFLSDQPEVRFEPTDKRESIAGYNCKVTIAHFQTDSVPPIFLYHTDEIELLNPNWYTQFADMEEVLLGYEIEQFGMRMQLRARQVIKRDIDSSLFAVPEKYTACPADEIKTKMRAMLSDFIE